MRKWLLAGIGVMVVSALAAAAVYALSFRPDPPPAGRPAAPETATVVRTDLSTSVILDGTLGYGAATTFTGRKSGTVTWLPGVGTVVDRGQRLYAVDAKPVALFLGDTPLYRTIDGAATPGPDIAEVNENLRALGFTAAPKGEAYTPGTTEALKQWQRHNGLDATGALAAGDVAVLPAPVRVDSLQVQPGAPGTAELLDLTSTTKLVTATVDEAEADTGQLAPGSAVTLSLSGKQVQGEVTAVDVSAEQEQTNSSPAGGSGESGKQTTVTITIGDPTTVSDVDSGPVGVTVPTDSREGVLAVPVESLVVVQGGDFAVQVVTGRGSRLTSVRTGMFADGLVEVSGKGISEGMRVVTVS